ncbi:MAG: triose-phosphate isomerase [Brevinemataceae bacterium]
MKVLIAGNWKMHKTISEGVKFVNEMKSMLDHKPNRGVLLCVPFTMLHAVSEAAKGSVIMIGAENFFYEEKGAFTGEISPEMIKDAGAQAVLIGHSERRELFGETNDSVNKKIKAALKHQIMPVLCVGETLEERELSKLEEVLTTQLKTAFKDISEQDAEKVIIAYEPIWAIGTGKTASPQDADQAHLTVRTILASLYNKTIADNMFILYGGSVKADNIDELIATDNINGALVGGASLEVESFARIANFKCSGNCGRPKS